MNPKPESVGAERLTSEKRPVGRPPAVGGKRVQVYLDDDSLARAAQLGHGNVSDGIRQALKSVGHPK